MEISEQELREMVRAAIARHTGGFTPPAASAAGSVTAFPGHASHARLPLLSGGDSDGQCLIEPAVKCNHCGYCLSLGH
jgi:hypothetical protein